MREVQIGDAIGMRVETDKVKGSTAVLFFRRADVTPDIAAKTAEIRTLLKLPEGGSKFTLTYSRDAGRRMSWP